MFEKRKRKKEQQENERIAEIRKARIRTLADTVIYLRPESDYWAETVTEEDVQERAIKYGMEVTEEEARDALIERKRHRI